MRTRDILGFGAGALAAIAVSQAAWGQPKAAVDAAKAAGVVGEQADGFLGFVTATQDPALRSAVDQINAGRAQVYREAAARSGATPEAAGAAAFLESIQPRLQPGQFYKPSGSGWVRK